MDTKFHGFNYNVQEGPDDWHHYFKETSRIPVAYGNHTANINVFKSYTVEDLRRSCVDVDNVLVFCVHGCGLSAMSWATTSIVLAKSLFVAAVDLRGHGESFGSFDDVKCLNVEVLVNDLTVVLRYLLQEFEMQQLCQPKVVLLGHSIGGALCIKLAPIFGMMLILATIVIDYMEDKVEGNALGHTMEAVNAIPLSFSHIEEALDWIVSSGHCLSRAAAQISLPSRLTSNGEELLVVTNSHLSLSSKWKCHPKDTKQHWESWVKDTTREFLCLKCMKALVVTDVNGLGKELTTAYMQGAFQLKPLPGNTHLIQEDAPNDVANIVLGVVMRNLRVQRVLSAINKHKI